MRALAEGGTREVTLLGQTVNSYGKNMPEGRVPFSELLRLVAGVPGIERVRFTSPYPRDFRADLIAAMRDAPAVMESCHMPLQSGSDTMLRRMRRLYTVEGFRAIMGDLRGAMPGIGISTDVIVGFPGETEGEFDDTMRLMAELRFDQAFLFAYSPRPGTAAETAEDQVPTELKKERLNRLIAQQETIMSEIHEGLVGGTFEVLVEGPSPKDPARMSGFTREGRMMHFPAPAERAGRLALVRATAGHRWGLSGELV